MSGSWPVRPHSENGEAEAFEGMGRFLAFSEK